MHNFPMTFDKLILETGTRVPKKGGYTEYSLPGTINGRSGRYEIGVKNKAITHRFFNPKPKPTPFWWWDNGLGNPYGPFFSPPTPPPDGK